MCLKHIRTNAFDPFDLIQTDNQSADDENDNGIIIDHETEEEPIVSDILDNNEPIENNVVDGEELPELLIEGQHVSMVITENETSEPEPDEIIEQNPPILPNENTDDEVPEEPTPITEEDESNNDNIEA